jgi:lysophospholipase L1-like esterase
VLDNVYNWLTANPADIVLLHIGTNDITYGGQDANEVSDILDEIDRFSTDIKVILALIIDRRTHSPETTQFNINVNNMAQNRITAGDDIIVVDMEHALNYATNMADELHPNNSGYAKMAGVWFNVLDSVINPPLITSTPIMMLMPTVIRNRLMN